MIRSWQSGNAEILSFLPSHLSHHRVTQTDRALQGGILYVLSSSILADDTGTHIRLCSPTPTEEEEEEATEREREREVRVFLLLLLPPRARVLRWSARRLTIRKGGGGGKKGVASSFVLVRFAECQRLKEKSGYSSSYPSSSFLQGQYRTVYMPADSSFLQITSVSTKSKYRGCPLLCVGLSLRLFFY